MVVARLGVGLADSALGVPAEHVAREGELLAGAEVRLARPVEVRAGTQVDFVELVGALGPEQRVVQLRVAVLAAEEQPEAVLEELRVAREAAADAQTRIDLEAVGVAVGIDVAARIEEFDRDRAFPGTAAVERVDVDAGGRAGEVGELGDQRERRDRFERGGDLTRRVGARSGADVVEVHAEVEHLAVHAAAGPTAGDRGGLRLGGDVVAEDVGLGIDIGRDRALFENDGAQGCHADVGRAVDGHHRGRRRALIGRVDARAVGGGGQRAVERVNDRSAGRQGGDRLVEWRAEEPTADREARVVDLVQQAVLAGAVGAACGWLKEVSAGRGIARPTVADVGILRRECRGELVDHGTVEAAQGEVFAAVVE